MEFLHNNPSPLRRANPRATVSLRDPAAAPPPPLSGPVHRNAYDGTGEYEFPTARHYVPQYWRSASRVD
jgi:hypothetical protein